MKFMITHPYESLQAAIAEDISTILSNPRVPLRTATPPTNAGVYILTVADEVMYVGEAKGNGGLRDRLLSKHISGDDSHAIQRAYKKNFPDRMLRREHIKDNVWAQWLAIDDIHRASTIERVLIWMFNPPWNIK